MVLRSIPLLFLIILFRENLITTLAKVIGNIFVAGFMLYLLLMIIFGEIYARMTYNRWKYEFTETNLKLERGIIWKGYSNVPYERVQNVDIQRGIIARMLGFSSVHIQTAGFSYGTRGHGAEGYIPAVDMAHAEQIRDFLMKKIQHRSKQGL